MKIISEPVIARDLKPGDLFSIASSEYWEHVNAGTSSIGECVYIRTNTPASNAPDSDEMVYKITIEREE